MLCLVQYRRTWGLNVFSDVNNVQGPPGQKGDQGATEIIDYNGNIQEALQVRQVINFNIDVIVVASERATSAFLGDEAGNLRDEEDQTAVVVYSCISFCVIM